MTLLTSNEIWFTFEKEKETGEARHEKGNLPSKCTNGTTTQPNVYFGRLLPADAKVSMKTSLHAEYNSDRIVILKII